MFQNTSVFIIVLTISFYNMDPVEKQVDFQKYTCAMQSVWDIIISYKHFEAKQCSNFRLPLWHRLGKSLI